ncbi:MAG: hypothetical protein M1825_003144 [Sarcosagium campestre]|nr:MAG: hypothetical protein M1825_003144 [Sarcosagium campestre]
MALAMKHLAGGLTVAAGFESGHTMVFVLQTHPAGRDSIPASASASTFKWQRTYTSQPHSQPVLSLDLHPTSNVYYTSSADATIAKHPLPSSMPSRSPSSTTTITTAPLATLATKHAGQQGLSMRSDGRVFATAGWDSRARVYSTGDATCGGGRSMRELAVLAWHREGCYTVAFADVAPMKYDRDKSTDSQPSVNDARDVNEDGVDRATLSAASSSSSSSLSMINSTSSSSLSNTIKSVSLAERRARKTRDTHWLAVGSKDGKVSLWDIY